MSQGPPGKNEDGQLSSQREFSPFFLFTDREAIAIMNLNSLRLRAAGGQ